jgi:hypothetical protein
LDNKTGPKDSTRKEINDSSLKKEDTEKIKENNNKLKDLVKKLKKEKDDLKAQLENFSSNKENNTKDLKLLEKIKEENKNLLSKIQKLEKEKKDLNEKIRTLENGLNEKSEKKELKSSFSLTTKQKKYKCKLTSDKNCITFGFEKVKDEGIIEFNLTVKNMADELPKNCEFQLMNDIKGLTLEECKIKNNIKTTEVIQIKLKVDLDAITLNDEFSVKLKLLDDKKKDIEGGKCKVNIKIEKEEIEEKEEKEEQKEEEKEEIKEKEKEFEVSSNNAIFLDDNDYQELFEYTEEILSIQSAGEDITSFKNKVISFLEDKKDKYAEIKEKTEYLEVLKEDLLELFQI